MNFTKLLNFIKCNIWFLVVFVAAATILFFNNHIILQMNDNYYFLSGVYNAVCHGQWIPLLENMGDPLSLIDKPPLVLWLVAFSNKLFGFNEFFVRLPISLGSLGFLIVWFFFIRKYFDDKYAAVSSLMLATTFGFVNYGKDLFLDTYLMIFIALANITFFYAIVKLNFKYALLSLFFIYLGFLSKGPAILLYTLPVQFGYLLFFKLPIIFRNKLYFQKIFKSLSFYLFLMVAGIISLLIILFKDNLNNAIYLFFLHGKFGNSPHNYFVFNPSWQALVNLFVVAFPWTVFILSPFKVFWQKRNNTLISYMFFWFFFDLIFIMFFNYNHSESKYFLPLLPPLVFFLSYYIYYLKEFKKDFIYYLHLGLTYVFLAIVILGSVSIKNYCATYPMLYISIILLISFCVLIIVTLSKKERFFLLSAIFAVYLFFISVISLLPEVNKREVFHNKLLLHLKNVAVENKPLYIFSKFYAYKHFLRYYFPANKVGYFKYYHEDIVKKLTKEKDSIVILDRNLSEILRSKIVTKKIINISGKDIIY